MINAWLTIWRNIFNFTGTTTRREYWLALVTNVLAMYLGVIPFALVLKAFTGELAVLFVAIILYIVIFALPMLSLYFRRARDAGWKMSTAVFLGIALPGVSALFVGIIKNCARAEKTYVIMGKVLAFCFALYFYGSMLGTLLHGDPAAFFALPMIGLLGGTITLIVVFIKKWR